MRILKSRSDHTSCLQSNIDWSRQRSVWDRSRTLIWNRKSRRLRRRSLLRSATSRGWRKGPMSGLNLVVTRRRMRGRTHERRRCEVARSRPSRRNNFVDVHLVVDVVTTVAVLVYDVRIWPSRWGRRQSTRLEFDVVEVGHRRGGLRKDQGCTCRQSDRSVRSQISRSRSSRLNGGVRLNLDAVVVVMRVRGVRPRRKRPEVDVDVMEVADWWSGLWEDQSCTNRKSGIRVWGWSSCWRLVSLEDCVVMDLAVGGGVGAAAAAAVLVVVVVRPGIENKFENMNWYSYN